MGEMVYRFKPGARLTGLEPQAIGEELTRLRETAGAGFNPRTIVEAARVESSALNPAIFHCSVEEAAEEHWEDRAAYLVRNVVIVYEDANHQRRLTNAFVSVRERETDEVRYLPVFTAMSDEDYRQQITLQALESFLQLRHKYQEYKEFARVFAAIDAAAKRIRAA